MKTSFRLTQPEASRLLVRLFPDLPAKTRPDLFACGPYRLMIEFTVFTQELIRQRDVSGLRRCFRAAGRLHQRGDYRLRSAVETVYLYGLQFEEIHLQTQQIKQLFPPVLQEFYQKITTANLP